MKKYAYTEKEREELLKKHLNGLPDSSAKLSPCQISTQNLTRLGRQNIVEQVANVDQREYLGQIEGGVALHEQMPPVRSDPAHDKDHRESGD